jgi:hypothetical protein
MDPDRAEVLRRTVALYRRYLREGVSDTLAATYLRKIALAEIELKALERVSADESDGHGGA